MIFLEIIVVLIVGFLVYKFILMPSFSTKKFDFNNIPKEFEELFIKFNEFDFSKINSSKKSLITYSIVAIICLIAFLFTFIFTYLNSYAMSFSLIPLIILIIAVVMFLFEYKKFKLLYNDVISKFIKLIDTNLNYNNTSFNREKEFYEKAEFDNQKLNTFLAKDTINGISKDNYKFYISNISTTTTSDNGFNGLFSTVILDKTIQSYTKINTENIEYSTSYTLGKTNSHLEYIEMDNSNFNKVLHVYSSNRLKSTEILTSDILDYLYNFYDKYHVNFQIVFTGKYVYSRFFITQLFTPSFIGNLFNKNNFALCYVIINFMLDIISKLSNNMSNFEE